MFASGTEFPDFFLQPLTDPTPKEPNEWVFVRERCPGSITSATLSGYGQPGGNIPLATVSRDGVVTFDVRTVGIYTLTIMADLVTPGNFLVQGSVC